jgi:hypothetical protein
MNSPAYFIPLPDSIRNRLSKGWLLLGTTALAFAGLFAGLLVHAQRKGDEALFYMSLVIHVDLSVLVWFMAVASLLWYLFISTRKIPFINGTSFTCFALGTLCLPLAVFIGQGEPYMNNYIPIITRPIFLLGLSLIFSALVLSLASVLLSEKLGLITISKVLQDGESTQRFGLLCAGLITLISLTGVAWAHHLIPSIIEGEQYFELLFWGGGHALQFAHTQMAMLIWLWLASLIGLKLCISPGWVAGFYVINLLAALLSVVGFLAFDITSSEFRGFFTQLMKWGNAVAPAAIMLALLWSLRDRSSYTRDNRALWSALICSVVLFGVGGLLGYRIDGSNVTVPAHYHGSIVGVTLAYMGIAYYLLPHMGFAKVTPWKLATFQPIFYCIGQLCWIAGMVILGGYGQARKQASLPEAETTIILIGNILKRSGDGLSLLGGLLFVIVVAMAVMKRPKAVAA